MEFKRSIIITDPCYFANDSDWGEGFDYESLIINDSLGFSNYVWEPTGTGDGSWVVYGLNSIKGQIELEDHINKVRHSLGIYKNDINVRNRIDLHKLLQEESPVGRFCVDSGTFGIFYLDEVLKYCPSFLADTGEWCYTIIPDFIGLVEVDGAITGSDEGDFRDFCIKGIGNKTFYSR